MREICWGFLTFNGWESKEISCGISDDTLMYGNTVNPIHLTLVDKVDGDLSPMAVDFAAYSKSRRTEMSNKLANIASTAIIKGLAPCIPLYAADRGTDNPALSPTNRQDNRQIPALSVTEAFEALGLPKPMFIVCPYHVSELLLITLKHTNFPVYGGLLSFETHLGRFTNNNFEENVWKKLIARMLKLNKETVYSSFQQVNKDDLTRLRDSAAGFENDHARFAVAFLTFLLALKTFLSLLDEKMSDEVVKIFWDARGDFSAFVSYLPHASSTKANIDRLIYNIENYIACFYKYNKAPFKARSMSTYTLYSWKYSQQANLGLILSPTFAENLDFHVKAIQEGIAERDVSCVWGTSVASILPRHEFFNSLLRVEATIDIPASYQQHATNLKRFGFESHSIEVLKFALFATKKAREYSDVEENRQVCLYFSHHRVREFCNLILSIASYVPVDLQ